MNEDSDLPRAVWHPQAAEQRSVADRSRVLEEPELPAPMVAVLELIRAENRRGAAPDGGLSDEQRSIYEARREQRFEGVRDYIELACFLNHEQIAALLAGTPLVYGVAEFESCVYEYTGGRIHVRLTAAAEARFRTSQHHSAEPAGEDRVSRPLCDRYGAQLCPVSDQR